MAKVREYTLKLMEAMDEHIIDPRLVADMALAYMSEADVADMCRYNDIFQEDEDGEVA